MVRNLLSVSGLSKSYGGFAALREMDFTLKTGETKGIMGPNGAGKSTFLRLLSGELHVSGGFIEFLGRRITGWPVERRSREGLVYLPQRPSLFPGLSVRDHLLGAARAKNPFCRIDPEREVERLLQLFKLAGRSDEIAASLPYGEKRLLDLATSLATRPRVLLADEPTAGVDQDSAERISDLLIGLTESEPRGGVGVEGLIFVEHDRNVLFSVADEIGFLKSGKLVAEGPPGIIKERRSVKEYLEGHTIDPREVKKGR